MSFLNKSGGKGLFGGMKIKGPAKPSVPQSETSFNNFKKQQPSQIQEPVSPQQKKIEPIQQIDTKRKASVVSSNYQQPTSIKQNPITIQLNKKTTQQSIKQRKASLPVSQIKQSQSQQPIKKIETIPSPSSENTFVNNKSSSEKGNKNELQQTVKPTKQKNQKKNSEEINMKSKSASDKEKKQQQNNSQTPKPRIQKKQQSKNQKDSILQQMNQYHIKHLTLIQKQKEQKQKIIQMTGLLLKLKEQLKFTTTAQCEAVQKQEYEQADAMQSKMDKISTKIGETEQQLKNAQQNFNKLQYQQLNFLKTVFNDHKRISRKLKMFELQLMDQVAQLKKSEGEKIQQQNNKLDQQKKKIQKLDKDISYQEEQADTFQKQILQELNNKKSPLDDELSTLQTNKNMLVTEIQQLEKLLKEKKKQLNQTKDAIKEVQKEITEIVEEFRQERNNIKQRRDKVNQMKEQRTKIQTKTQEMDRDIQKIVQQMSNITQNLTQQATSITKLAEQIQKKSVNFDDKLQERKVKLQNFIHNTKILNEFQEKHRGTRQKIKEMQFKKANVSAQVSKHEERKKEIKEKIPVLLAEQKQMANTKNFKVAAQKKTEIKQAQDQIDKINKTIENIYIQEKVLDETISKIQEEQLEFIEEENDIKKNLAISQYKYQMQKYQTIAQEKEWLINSKIGNKKTFMQMIETELQNIQEQLEYLRQQYGLEEDKKATTSKQTAKEQQLKQINEDNQQDVKPEHTENQHQEQTIDNNNSQQQQQKTSEMPQMQRQEQHVQYSKQEPAQQQRGQYQPLQLD